MYRKNKILIVENRLGSYAAAVKGLGELTNDVEDFLKEPNKYSLVMFTGGEDVDPSLYDDTSPHQLCSTNLTRDKFEVTIFECALDNKIQMIGICRGVQFLTVMAGGRLMHDITGHAGSIHKFDSFNLKTPIKVNSFHHQMIVPDADSRIIGWSVDKLSEQYYGSMDRLEGWGKPEVEAAVFPSIRACGVQYHPEWMDVKSNGFMYFYNMANRLIKWPMDKFVQCYTECSTGKDINAKQKSNDIHSCFSCAT